MTGIRLAIGLLTAVPVGAPTANRIAAGRAMSAAPGIGLGLGLLAAGAGAIAELAGLGAFTVAVLAVAALALLSRFLHLDGLADTADAIGSGKPAAEALAVMKRADIGPFGVVTLLLVVLLQVGALAEAYASGHGAASLVVAAVAARLALPIACRRGVPSARPDGLGALVAGTVGPAGLAAAGAVTALVAVGAGLASELDVWRTLLAAVVAAGVGLGLVALLVRRFRGVTGDVLGAVVETTTAATLLVLA